MIEADFRFIYDQALESLVRLESFSVAVSKIGNDDTAFDEDLVHMRDLLAKRDFLIFSATLRNFAEITDTVDLMKSKTAITSELHLSSGVPFHRDMRRSRNKGTTLVTINLYQIVSRILHAHNIAIMSNPYELLHKIALNTDDYFTLVAEHGISMQKEIDPMVMLKTKQDPQTFILVSRILGLAKSYFNAAISHLEEDNIFIARGSRDLM